MSPSKPGLSDGQPRLAQLVPVVRVGSFRTRVALSRTRESYPVRENRATPFVTAPNPKSPVFLYVACFSAHRRRIRELKGRMQGGRGCAVVIGRVSGMGTPVFGGEGNPDKQD